MTALDFFAFRVAECSFLVSPEELARLLAAGSSADPTAPDRPPIVVDVRPAPSTKIAGAAEAPVGLVKARAMRGQNQTVPSARMAGAGRTERAAKVVLVGGGESCSSAAEVALLLLQARYTHVRELRGGFPAWVAAGLPVEPVKGPRPEPADYPAVGGGGTARHTSTDAPFLRPLLNL